MEIEVHVLLICGVTYNIEFQVHTRDDFWEYMFRGLIPTLYPERNVYGRQMTSKTQTADLLNHRIGSLRLRQIRITNSNYICSTVALSVLFSAECSLVNAIHMLMVVK